MLFFSCSKQDLDHLSEYDKSKRTSDPDEYNFEYYLDNESILQEHVDFEDTTNLVLVEVGTEDDLSIIRYNIFTTASMYFDYGRILGIDLTVYQTIEDILSTEAINSGVIDYVESHEYIPQWWSDFEQNIIDSLLGTNKNNKSISGFLHSECIGGDNLLLIPNIGQPWLKGLGWHKKVSAFTPLLTGGVHFMYDKAFYNKRVRTFYVWGFNRVTFCPPLQHLNNRAASWLNFGL